jgi:hypothetical protein
MSDGISFDVSQILELAADLGAAPKKAGANIYKAFQVTSGHVKEDWQKPLEGSETIPRGSQSISYDIESDGKTISSDIGPTLKGQGPLVGMLEYGTPSTSPRGFGAKALKKNEGDFQKGLEQAIEDVL